MSNQKISGQLIVRNTGENEEVTGPGRKLVMVFGVLAVPEDFPLQGEHQYVAVGGYEESLRRVVLNVLPDFGRSLENWEHLPVDGWRPDQLLTAPIWKV